MGVHRSRFEGERPVFEHGLGETRLGIHRVDVEVAEHGVGFPTAKQLDGVLIHVGAEESSGSPRAEAARADEVWGNASRFVQGGGRMSKGVGDVLRFDGPLLTVVRVVCTDIDSF